MPKASKGAVWVHVDHLDNAEGDIWAVQIRSRKLYLTAHSVQFNAVSGITQTRKKQPRAYLRFFCRVKIERNGNLRKVILY